MATLIKPNGETTEVNPKGGNLYSLEELQGYVGGYIELISLPQTKFLVINEEGKLYNLSLNRKATSLARFCGAIAKTDFIVGPALVIRHNEID